MQFPIQARSGRFGRFGRFGRIRALAVATLALTIAACGGDDGGGGDNGTDPPPDDEAVLTVPLRNGSVWTYREISDTFRTAAVPETSTVLIAIAGTETFSHGTYACVVTDEDGVRDPSYSCVPDQAVYIRQDGDLIYYVPEGLLSRLGGDDPINTWFLETALASLPWVYADFTAREGTERILLDASTTVPVDGGTADLSILVRSQELGAEAVDVPAGRYASRRNRTIILATVSSDKGVFTSRITQNFWFVDDLGLARIDFRDEEIAGSVFLSTEEVSTQLVDWDLARHR